jgi:hypothetical protein
LYCMMVLVRCTALPFCGSRCGIICRSARWQQLVVIGFAGNLGLCSALIEGVAAHREAARVCLPSIAT